MQQIPLSAISGIRIGQVQDEEAATGVTVILCPDGMAASVDVRGGGPASRDSRILDPLATADRIHAVVLAGGSAFGLDAAGGVQRYLEEHGFGLDMGIARVPLVCQSDIFDLGVGDSSVRPDVAMGYAACQAAEESAAGNYRNGNYGAGCGATVGKILGPEFAMKSGIGSCAVQVGPLQVAAVVVVNAAGDVFDPADGRQIAGLLSQDKRGLRRTDEVMYALYEQQAAGPGAEPPGAEPPCAANTTIGAIITNAALSKAQLCKVAGMGHDGMARAICPVHTSMDGDSLYALSVGEVPAPMDLVGTLAAQAVPQAILKAVESAEPAYGLPSCRSLR